MDQRIDGIRPILLYSLVSKNVFTESSQNDFFLSLVPFFEPFVEAHDGEVVDVSALREYATNDLFLPLPVDVVEIFIDRMVRVGWATREMQSAQGVIYRFSYKRSQNKATEYVNLDRDLDQLLAHLVAFAQAHFPTKANLNSAIIENDFILFIVRYVTTQMGSDSEVEDEKEKGKWDYIFGRYLGYLKEAQPAEFELVQRVAGVAMVAEALIELRNPTIKTAPVDKQLFVYLDGPLLMDYLGLSGDTSKQSALFIIDRLKKARVQVLCFKHTSDEIRNNLLGLLGRPRHERTGPTNEAIKRGEVQEAQCNAVAQNPEHFIKTIAGIPIQDDYPEKFSNNAKYCPDDVVSEIADRMPSGTELGRRHDANSVCVVMRRRAGVRTRNMFEARFALITSNQTVVVRANEVLRDRGLLPSDRTILGPAINQRTVAGLVFASGGLEDKKEMSRRQLLGACARVVMMRPRVLEQVRQQLDQLGRINDKEMLNAMITQPRGSQVFMDYVMGASRPISATNVDELLRTVRASVHEEAGQVYEHKLLEVQSVFNKRFEEVERVVKTKDDAIGSLEEALREARDKESAQGQRLRNLAISHGERAIAFATHVQYLSYLVLGLLLTPMLAIPSFDNSTPMGKALVFVSAGLGAVSTIAFLLNVQMRYLEQKLEEVVAWRFRQLLRRDDLLEFEGRFKVNFKERKVEFDKPTE